MYFNENDFGELSVPNMFEILIKLVENQSDITQSKK